MAGFGAVYTPQAAAPLPKRGIDAAIRSVTGMEGGPQRAPASPQHGGNSGQMFQGTQKNLSGVGGPAQIDYSAILKAFGNQPAAAPAAPMTNTSTPNPTISAINQKQLARADGDMNAGNLGRASDIAIRDNAENERKALLEGQASRGVTGGGLQDAGQAAISRDTLRNQTSARTGIANDAEARKDALYGQIAGQEAVNEGIQNQQRGIALNQQSMAFQQQQSARDSELMNFRNVLDLFGSIGLNGAR